MKQLSVILLLVITSTICRAQLAEESVQADRKNAVYVEFLGRGYYSLNYERAWRSANRAAVGFGWNHHETYLTDEEQKELGYPGDHEVSPYLSFYSQYSRVIGKNRSKLELGAGTTLTFLDMERWEIAHDLYENESYITVYPIIGYRFEGYNGIMFLFTFNPIIQLPQGSFWPIPGISAGYRF